MRIKMCKSGFLQRTLIILLTMCLFNLSGCADLQQVPNLGMIYNEPAIYRCPDRNPIIVIPGILRSRLAYPPKGTIAWGAFEIGAADPSGPDGARIIALPIGSEGKLNQMHDEVVSTGVLDNLRISLGGISLNIQAYAGILRTLGVGGYRDEALDLSREVDYGGDHFTCFQFAYDWRRDNVENARLLYDFIKEKQAYVRQQYKQRFRIDKKDIKFDIAAHSMGGLITRYFLMYGTQDLPEDGSLPELNWNRNLGRY